MAIHDTQSSQSNGREQPPMVEIGFHPANDNKKALGCLKLLSGAHLMMMFFSSRERGIAILVASVKRELISADAAPAFDSEIRAMPLPEKEIRREARVELTSKEKPCGTVLLLTENDQLMAFATHLPSLEAMEDQADYWFAAYGCVDQKAEKMKREFFAP